MSIEQRRLYEKWIYEIDGEGAYNLRIERFLSDVASGQLGQAQRWLEAAFQKGYDAGRKESK